VITQKVLKNVFLKLDIWINGRQEIITSLLCPDFRGDVLQYIRPFSFVSHVAQKVFNLETFTGMLTNMCSCAPGYFHVDLFSIFRVIALVFDIGS
jgi:hypothetical protein